jgi:gluconate 2-dehydrogenase gamma chain
LTERLTQLLRIESVKASREELDIKVKVQAQAMETEDLSRRSLLQAIVATIGAAALPLGWAEIAQAAHQTHADSKLAGEAKLSFLSAAEAADVEAVAAQIIPTDDTPGAREAGVVYFIDRALATCLSQLASDYRAQLTEFQVTFRGRHPGTSSFASLPSEEQVEYLKTVDRTPFFDTTRLLTLLGMFSMPAYGGNRNGVGWKLIGFEDRHAFQPPFGYYDREYPGFVDDRTRRP